MSAITYAMARTGTESPANTTMATQSYCQRYHQPARGEVSHIGDDAFTRHAADLSADKLDGDHERRRQKNRPQQGVTKLRCGLGIGRDAGRIIVRGARNQPRSEQPQQIFAGLCGGLAGSALEEFIAPVQLSYTKMQYLPSLNPE
jgi:hypothetical protein